MPNEFKPTGIYSKTIPAEETKGDTVVVSAGGYKEVKQMSVTSFPVVHNFLLCPKCDSSAWHISWPKDKELEWYVQCLDCSQQYKQGLITGLKTPNEGKT